MSNKVLATIFHRHHHHHHPLLHTPTKLSRSSVAAIAPFVRSSSDQPLCHCQDLCSWFLLQGIRYFRSLACHPRSLVSRSSVYCYSDALTIKCDTLHPGVGRSLPRWQPKVYHSLVYCFLIAWFIWWLLLCSLRPNVFGLSLFRRVVLLTCLWSLCILVLAALSLATNHVWSRLLVSHPSVSCSS